MATFENQMKLINTKIEKYGSSSKNWTTISSYFKKCDDKEPCAICMENEDSSWLNMIIKTGCNHTYHIKCILQWVARGNQTCPCCRSVNCE